MKRLVLAFTLSVSVAVAHAEGLKLPDQKPVPAPPTQAAPEADEPAQFVILPAPLLAQIQAVIAAQRREIERLRALASKGGCI